jgi:hypothetical protein
MSEDWTNKLNDEQREGWDEFVQHFRRDALVKMTDSALVAQLVPDKDKFDVKFAVELGAAIMLDKPILAIVMPGTHVPPKLRMIADEFVEADIDTEEGRKEVARAIARMTEALS